MSFFVIIFIVICFFFNNLILYSFALLFILNNFIYEFLLNLFNQISKSKLFLLLSFFQLTCFVNASILSLYFNFDLIEFLICATLLQLIFLIFLCIYNRKAFQIKASRKNITLSLSDFYSIWKTVMILNPFNFVLLNNDRLITYLYNNSFDLASIGIFSSCTYSVYNAFVSLVQKPFSPRIYDTNSSDSKIYFYFILAIILTFGLLHTLISLSFAEEIIIFFSNNKFVVYSEYLYIFSIATFALILKNYLQIIGLKNNFYIKYVYPTILVSIISLLINISFYKNYGFKTFALANLTSFILLLALTVYVNFSFKRLNKG